MEIPVKYIIDANGQPNAVVMDYEIFKKIEDLFLDLGLAKAMSEVEDDEEYDLETAMKMAFKVNLIDNENIWIEMLENSPPRRMTVHTYSIETALDVYKNLSAYLCYAGGYKVGMVKRLITNYE